MTDEAKGDGTNRSDAATNQDPWTVLRLLSWTTDFFRQRGSDSPRLDAEVLLAHSLGCSRIELYTAFGSEPSGPQRQTFRELVRRRGEGVPVAYLVGHREFYSLRLGVTPAVLIPRPETEHLVTLALDHAKSLAPTGSARTGTPADNAVAQCPPPTPTLRPLKIADVGTGSGAIAVALAKHLPAVYPGGCLITAIDLSPDALDVARGNARDHGVDPHIEFVQGDLLNKLPAGSDFDMILSNPPYVSRGEYADLEPTVRDHEPKMALLAGERGTEIIARLIDQAASRLRPGGLLAIELSPMIAKDCSALVAADGHFHEPKLIRDLGGNQRIVTAIRH
jgi:release factor glutamine methyltransferase